MSILVIGGTGTVGSQVTAGLLAQGKTPHVLVRSAEKARSLPRAVQATVGSLEDFASLEAALRGIESLFLLAPVNPRETEMGINAVRAAQEAGVQRLVYLSVFHVEEGQHIPHFGSKVPVEVAIQDSGISFTILRPNEFIQNDAQYRKAIVESGVYPHPIGDVGVHRVDVRDIADAAVNALIHTGHEDKIHPLVGPRALTGNEVAEIYSRLLGKQVSYAGSDLGAWAKEAGKVMPAEAVEDLRIMFEHFHKQGMLATEEDHKSRDEILGHAPRRFEDYAGELTASWTAGESSSEG